MKYEIHVLNLNYQLNEQNMDDIIILHFVCYVFRIQVTFPFEDSPGNTLERQFSINNASNPSDGGSVIDTLLIISS